MDDLPSLILKLVAVALLVGANAFFVAVEFALVSVRRTRLEELARDGHRSARAVQRALNDIDRYIAGAQVGITLASILLVFVAEPAAMAFLDAPLSLIRLGAPTKHAIAFAVAYAATTFMHVVFGEQVPKCFALQKAEATALWLIRPMQLAMVIFRPLVWLLNGVSQFVLRLLRLDPAGKHGNVHSVEELEILVRQSHEAGVLDQFEREIVQHSLGFSELTAGDVMIPRPDMVALDLSAPLDRLLESAAQTIHTRFPVYDGSIDHIIGILHLQDLYREAIHSPRLIDVRALLRPPLIVPETVHLDSLVEQFRTGQSQIAIVIDEHGGTSGLVTLEDVVEEVFGEMHDALEAAQPQIQHVPDGRILVRGDVRLDEVHDDCGWNLVDEESDTIAGFVMNRLGRTARVGDRIEVTQGTIRVENMARHRITQVAMLQKAAESSGPNGEE